MSRFVSVDCEAFGNCPGTGRLTEFGAVTWKMTEFHGVILQSAPSAENPAVPERVKIGDVEYYEKAERVFLHFDAWLIREIRGRPIMISDNPAFDFMWICDGFWRTLGRN